MQGLAKYNTDKKRMRVALKINAGVTLNTVNLLIAQARVIINDDSLRSDDDLLNFAEQIFFKLGEAKALLEAINEDI